jgi:dienelactone hydrolase
MTWYYQHQWWATFRSMVEETVTDYRRALDYLHSRPDVDVSHVSAVGVSMGGITAAYLAAADPRVQTVVSVSAVFSDGWLFPLTHLNLAPALKDRRMLTLVGDADGLVDVASVRRFHELVDSQVKELRVFPSGHQPPPEWTDLALEWITARTGLS